MKIAVVTSCSHAGWDEYGHRCVETFMLNWPAEVDLHLVSENLPSTLESFHGPKRSFTVWNLLDHSPARSFYEEHKDNLAAQGYPNKKNSKEYSFRHDAWKFSKKVFAIAQVYTNTVGYDRLFWLDADITTFSPVPMKLLESLPPTGADLAVCTRGTYHSECGFIGYNLSNAFAASFIPSLANVYSSGKVFELKEWHDSWVFDWLCREGKFKVYSIPHRNSGNPIAYSELGQYFDHRKGRRKNYTWSPDHPAFGGHERNKPWKRR